MTSWRRLGRVAGPAAALAMVLAVQRPAAAPAQPQPAQAAEGPATLNAPDVEAWIALKIDPAGWTYLYFDGDGAYFTLPRDVSLTGDKTYRLEIREELFAPDEMGARSMLMQTELDCSGRRLRLPGTRTFSQHNLQARAEDRPPVEQWVTPQDDRERQQFDQLCRLAENAIGSRGAPPAAADAGQGPGPEPPASLSRADVEAWIGRNLQTLGWRYVSYLTDGVNYLGPAPATPGPGGVSRVWTRAEFFRPQSYPAGSPPERSARQLLELDCAAGRWRIVEIDGFSRNNLSGEAVVNTDPTAAWNAFSPDAADGGALQRLCAASLTVAPGDPPPPDARDETTVRRWARRYLDVAGWTYVARNGDAIWMTDLKSTPVAVNGVRRVQIRQEFFTPVARGAATVRSERDLFEVDCRLRQFRVMKIQGFSAHGLKGGAAAGAPDPAWTAPEPGTTGAAMADRVCAAAAPARRTHAAASAPSRRPSSSPAAAAPR